MPPTCSTPSKENLPTEYGKIYQFDNWAAIQRHALREQGKEEEASMAAVGAFVRILLNVPAEFATLFGSEGVLGGVQEQPLILSGVNLYENRLTVRCTLRGPSSPSAAAPALAHTPVHHFEVDRRTSGQPARAIWPHTSVWLQVVPLQGKNRKGEALAVHTQDQGVRPNVTVAQMAKMKPISKPNTIMIRTV